MFAPEELAAIREAARVLRGGGLVAVPTETVYGLAADAENREAVLATFAAKGRPVTHPLIVHVAGESAISAWTSRVTPDARRLAAAFWPGPLTLVLPMGGRCRPYVTGGQDSVALRCPSHPWIAELFRHFAGGEPRGFTAPSCNAFGRISPTTAEHVRDGLGLKPEGKLDFILDGGPCPIGIESTIVNCCGPRAEILRHGAVTRAMLEEALGYPVADAGAAAPRASGRLKSHYAPRTPLELVPARLLPARCRELAGVRLALMASPAIAAVCRGDFAARFAAEASPQAYGRALYGRLHELDAAGAERILVELPPQEPAWAAVNDRLGRAAAEKDAGGGR
ncbi:MAG: threonylcarbamoyl-AMP synthase [Duodenibacillus sp.]|nr:threonylcarbamoyl-AMP synthase [Duodenibacillus sp.]